MILLACTTAWLSKDKFYNLAFVDGYTIGKKIGFVEGFKEGNDQACMVKPI